MIRLWDSESVGLCVVFPAGGVWVEAAKCEVQMHTHKSHTQPPPWVVSGKRLGLAFFSSRITLSYNTTPIRDQRNNQRQHFLRLIRCCRGFGGLTSRNQRSHDQAG